MDKKLLQKHISNYKEKKKQNPEEFDKDWAERVDDIKKYKSYTEEKLFSMDEEGLYEYISPLWAMRIWGNKRYVTDKLIEDNGIGVLIRQFSFLLWSEGPIEQRWDEFRKEVKGMGPAMISELLCKTHPDKYMIWNRRAKMGLNYLGVKDLPKYDYQLDGKKYKELCEVEQQIARELNKAGFREDSLLMVDYFIWHELQVYK